MCGIYGQLSPGPARRASLDALRHRGPDDAGMITLPVAGSPLQLSLGQRRLSIIDLSDAGHQPMQNEDGQVWVVFNGEIYNFQELRRELIAAGHCFTSKTDTEVLVHGYEQWGEALFPKLLGMFSVAIWDARRRQLLLARDRQGKKPLFYFQGPDRIYFASEIKALFASGEVPLEPDPLALHDYLTYLYFPYPKTAYKDIYKLPPASIMRINLSADGELQMHQHTYWDAAEESGRPAPATIQSAIEEARSLVEDAVRIRLMSDVPLGVFLSGGLDSGSIAAFAARHSDAPVRTFSIGFGGDAAFDETQEAALVAERLGTEHQTIHVEPDCGGHIETVVRAFDEPFGNPTAILEYLLTQRIRRHVTVALSGDGGDEVFGGYVRYAGVAMAERYRRLPRALTRGIIAPASRMIRESTTGDHRRRRFREFAESAWKPMPEMYLDWVGYFSEHDKQEMYSPEFARQIAGYDSAEFLRSLFTRGAALEPVNRAAYVDLGSFLTGNCLEYADRMSMANSLEVRCPLTDHRLVEFGLRLPPEWKLKGGRTKHILREAMRSILPEAVIEKKKMGFNPPMPRWLNQELRPMIADLLSRSSVERRGFFRYDSIARLLDEHAHARRDHALKIWALLVLEVWCRLYIDAPVCAQLAGSEFSSSTHPAEVQA